MQITLRVSCLCCRIDLTTEEAKVWIEQWNHRVKYDNLQVIPAVRGDGPEGAIIAVLRCGLRAKNRLAQVDNNQ